MKQRSIREYDSLPDRIRLHRQADPRGILVVEGPSDARFIQRLIPERWAIFPAGTRNVVISTIEGTVALCVQRVAGLVDQDFDGLALDAHRRGLPVFWYGNADLEAVLFAGTALDSLLGELASEQKLSQYGGVQALRMKAISTALEVAALRAENVLRQWGLPFDNIDLSKKINRDDLSLKRVSYCQALAEACHVDIHHRLLHEAMEERISSHKPKSGTIAFFSGKDALTVVGVALKSRIGSCDSGVIKMEHLARILRLSAPTNLIEYPPFPEIATMIDAA